MFIQLTEQNQNTQQEQTKNVESYAVGIDLGTTNSVIAFAKSPDDIEVLAIQGHFLTPSVVQISDQSTKVGRQIQKQKPFFSSFKRYMHTPAEPIILDDDNQQYTKSPVELSSYVLDYLKRQAEEILGKPVFEAVITVPAFFDDTARQATKDAARLAGLQVLRLINEPTAAALAYGLDHGPEGLYAVYDLGGGTFDFSVLKMEKGVFRVLSTGGDTALGGDDIDHGIIKFWIKNGFVEEPNNAHTLQSLLLYAKAAKERLTTIEKISDPYPLSRRDLNTLLSPLLDRTFDVVKDVLQQGNLSLQALNGVILVGGATRIPYLREQVQHYFQQAPLTNLDPDQIVARGAALQASMLTSSVGSLLFDVTPLSLGLEMMGGIVERLIPRNSSLPIRVTQTFTTHEHNQTALSFHVVQGEKEFAHACRSLARFELHGIPPMPAGMARVDVTFQLDADGVLCVQAQEQQTGQQQMIYVKPSYGLTEDQLMEMLKVNQKNACDDLQKRLLVEARVSAERLLNHCRLALEKDRQLLDEDEVQIIQDLMNLLKSALEEKGSDLDQIKIAMKNLQDGTTDFAKKRLQRLIKNV